MTQLAPASDRIAADSNGHSNVNPVQLNIMRCKVIAETKIAETIDIGILFSKDN